MSNRNTDQNSTGNRGDNITNIISQTLVGVAGGTTLGSSFGTLGIILGSLIGVYFTGYAEYKAIYTKEPRLKKKAYLNH